MTIFLCLEYHLRRLLMKLSMYPSHSRRAALLQLTERR
jgi:hypothetical protein